VALEILEELPSAATLLVPVGGGGLIGGMGVVARALRPGLRVLGAQSVATASMHASLEAGRPVSRGAGPSICDGLAGDVDERSLALAQQVVDGMVLVEEREVRAAIRRLYEDDGVVAEGSGAAGVAALLSRPAPPGPVVVVVTGGNIDGRRLAEILTETE
jgi:threonine dehydratase